MNEAAQLPPSKSLTEFSFMRENTQTQLNSNMSVEKKPEKIVITTSETDALYN